VARAAELVNVLNVGLCRRDLRIGLGERRAIIAFVDARNHVAGFDMLVVGDRDRGEIARHLWGNRRLPCRDEGIVGRLKTPGVVDVKIAAA
jgi:hypothetical protein